MSEFTIRSESVDVEQIMKQIRARILEKRGADYTEEQIRELASVRLEKFLEPKNLRSDLLDQFRKSRPATATEPPKIEPPYSFDDQTLFASHRAPLRLLRKLLLPVLKLFFNPNVLNQILHTQSQFNVDLLKREARRKMEFDRSRAEWNSLYYEVLHNLVLETTRMGIEVQNLRMRVESLSSRLDFSERRVRALEGVVQYRPEALERREDEDEEDTPPGEIAPIASGPPGAQGPTLRPDGSRRRRRRRRGRRGAGALAGATGATGATSATSAQDSSARFETDESDEPPEASASAREESGELRRDDAEARERSSAGEGGREAPETGRDQGDPDE